jgi:hypothetical protein
MGSHKKSTRQTNSLHLEDPAIQLGERCSQILVGKTINSVRYLYTAEMKNMGWFKKSLVIFFTDGSFIYASADNEGNDAGAYFTSIKGMEVIPTI